jgi:hypothetical protein
VRGRADDFSSIRVAPQDVYSQSCPFYGIRLFFYLKRSDGNMFILVKRWRNAMAKNQTDNHNQTKTKKEKKLL